MLVLWPYNFGILNIIFFINSRKPIKDHEMREQIIPFNSLEVLNKLHPEWPWKK